MLVADAGWIFVPLVERAATAIAAGAVMGTFAGATAGFLSGWSRRQVERDALRDGYFGAVVVLVLLFIDVWNVYAT